MLSVVFRTFSTVQSPFAYKDHLNLPITHTYTVLSCVYVIVFIHLPVRDFSYIIVESKYPGFVCNRALRVPPPQYKHSCTCTTVVLGHSVWVVEETNWVECPWERPRCVGRDRPSYFIKYLGKRQSVRICSSKSNTVAMYASVCTYVYTVEYKLCT